MVSLKNDRVQSIFVLVEIQHGKWNINVVFIVSQVTGRIFRISSVTSVMFIVDFYVNVPMNKCLVNNYSVSRFTSLQDN